MHVLLVINPGLALTDNHILSVCFSASARLKTVDVLTRSLQAAESQVRKYESRLSEEDMVPADTAAIQALREQLKVRPADTLTFTAVIWLISQPYQLIAKVIFVHLTYPHKTIFVSLKKKFFR